MVALLKVEHLSKRFCRDLRRSLRYGVADILAELQPRRKASPLRRDEFWALDDISFTLSAGEAMAVVGSNGAGKSSLLRTIAGLLKPDIGEVRLHGAVQSMIDLSGGFNPTLTGRENLDLGFALRGTGGLGGRAGRSAQIEAAADFADLGDFLDAPLQSYSNGMGARLAFGLASQLSADLLLVDEALAVGDIGFQRKCVRHIRGHLDRGGALLFVSHNIFQIHAVCERGLTLDRGRVGFIGSAVDALEHMFERDRAQNPVAAAVPIDPELPWITGLERASAADPITTGGSLELVMSYVMTCAVEAICMISIWTQDQSVCIAIVREPAAGLIPAGAGERRCSLPDLPLVAGSYVVRAAILDAETLQPLAMFGYAGAGLQLWVAPAGDRFEMIRRTVGQLVEMPSRWN